MDNREIQAALAKLDRSMRELVETQNRLCDVMELATDSAVRRLEDFAAVLEGRGKAPASRSNCQADQAAFACRVGGCG